MVVLAGELLRDAEQLVNQKIHPMTIIAGVLTHSFFPSRIRFARFTKKAFCHPMTIIAGVLAHFFPHRNKVE